MKNLLLFLLLALISYNVQALKQEDLLHPDKAFQFSAQVTNEDSVQLKWKIADGYYMYRKRFAFRSETESITLNNAEALFPDGIIKQDPNLGEMEVYYDQVTIDIPIERLEQVSSDIELRLSAKFQGCAEAGLCYPPQRKRTKLILASIDSSDLDLDSDITPTEGADLDLDLNTIPTAGAGLDLDSDITPTEGADLDLDLDILPTEGVGSTLENDTSATTSIISLKQLRKSKDKPATVLPDADTAANDESLPPEAPLGILERIIANPKTLPVDKAFTYTLSAFDKNTLSARWQITPQHNLYRAKITFNVVSPENVQLGTPSYPTGKLVNDEFFGKMEVYDQETEILIPLLASNADSEKVTIETSYQGCSNVTGVCYPPVIQTTTLALDELTTTPARAPPTETNYSQTNEFFSGSFLGTLLAFFVIGLGLSLTPCIFPMIPILSGIIAGQSNLSASKAFILSLTYVLASASAYALIGLVFGFFGENLQSGLQHPLAIGLFAALFVILAFSMFGFLICKCQTPSSHA